MGLYVYFASFTSSFTGVFTSLGSCFAHASLSVFGLPAILGSESGLVFSMLACVFATLQPLTVDRLQWRVGAFQRRFRFSLPRLDSVLAHAHRPRNAVQLEVEAARVAHRLALVVASPEGGGGRVAVRALKPETPRVRLKENEMSMN